MTSILERLDDLIRGNLHRFVDRALERNSLILYDQDVRDMEDAIDHLEEATLTMYAAARANERRLEQHQAKLAELEAWVERLAAQGVPQTSERMMVAQGRVEAQQDLVAATQAQIERQQAQYETLSKQLAETKVSAETLKDVRPRLESLLALARAYRSVERVELTLDGLRGLSGDTEVAQVAEGVHRRLGEAEARLAAIEGAADMEMMAELEQAQLEDQLAARRQRLGLAPEPEESQPSGPEPSPTEPEDGGPPADTPEAPVDGEPPSDAPETPPAEPVS
jgi:phage shock protein A